ncbi:hypothetical protein [Paracoccus sp. 22332]|uniref:hypothetical protein n=1 Tax=Paracoccus sp. 22332 TaxID=3453913 RepID=UPI003F86FF1D
MAQFSVEITSLSGSVLGGNQQAWRSSVVLSPFHSAEARATVNEHIEIAKKKEMPRVSAQGVSAR